MWKGERERGFGFSSVFRGLSPRSLTRKPTYNKTCNPTYNPSYCPHTSAIARGGTAIGAFGTSELWLGKHGGEGKGAQRGEKVWEVGARVGKWIKGYENLLVSVKVAKELKKWLPSNFVDCKIFISMGVNLGVNLIVSLQ